MAKKILRFTFCFSAALGLKKLYKLIQNIKLRDTVKYSAFPNLFNQAN